MSPRYELGPPARLGYVESSLDHAANRRSDQAALLALADDPRARVYVIGGELIVFKRDGSDPLFSRAEAAALGLGRETVFLGCADGSGRFGRAIDQTVAEAIKARADVVVSDLRSIAVQGLVAAEHLPPIAQAKALLSWHARHRFCSVCGK